MIINPYRFAGGSPLDHADLVARYDAQDSQNGGNFTVDTLATYWSDLSGNGYDLDIVNVLAPTYRSGGPNSTNYLQFTTIESGLITTKLFTPPEMLGTGKDTFCWTMVLRAVNWGNATVFAKYQPFYDQAANRLGFESNSRLDFPNDQAGGKLTGWTSIMQNNTWHILQGFSDGSDKYVFLDGVQVATQVLSGGFPTDLAGDDGLLIGTNNPVWDHVGAIVDFAEFACYKSSLDATTRTAHYDHLAAKYSL